MNERIREFAKEAQQYAEYVTPQGLEWFDNFKEKFVELIVKDCVEFVENELIREMQSEDFAQYVAQRIKRYYGIIGTWYYEKIMNKNMTANEKIKQLAEQAEKYASTRGEPTWFEAFESKFAELIVEECISQCWSESELKYKGSVVSECSKRIRKHFGVEKRN